MFLLSPGTNVLGQPSTTQPEGLGLLRLTLSGASFPTLKGGAWHAEWVNKKFELAECFLWIGWPILLKDLSFSVSPHKGLDLSNDIFFRK